MEIAHLLALADISGCSSHLGIADLLAFHQQASRQFLGARSVLNMSAKAGNSAITKGCDLGKRRSAKGQEKTRERGMGKGIQELVLVNY